MVAPNLKRIMWRGLVRIISSHRLTHKLALNAYRRYENAKTSKELYSRVNRMGLEKRLDTSHKPNLNVILVVVDSLRNSRLSDQDALKDRIYMESIWC